MKALLQAGKICNVHGLKGVIKIQPWTDFPEVFENFKYLIINDIRYKVNDVKYHKSSVLIKLKGIDSINDAQNLINLIAYCEKTDLALSDNTFFVADLIGCKVLEGEQEIGTLTQIITTGTADVYEIENEGNRIYLAAIKENILSIDINNKIIQVKIPEEAN